MRRDGRDEPVLGRAPGQTPDKGAALILTVLWSAVLLLLAGVVSTAVVRQVRPSDQAERSFQAWVAAEAGVEDMRARLAANGDYWKSVAAYNADPVTNAAVASANPALAGWVDLPGGESDAQFSYTVDTSAAARSGRITISSTGRAGTGTGLEVRTVEAAVQKRTTNEYAYLSNSELYPYDAPGVYGPPGEESKDGKMSIDVASALCGTGGASGSRLWYEWTDWNGNPGVNGPVTNTSAQSTKVVGTIGTGPHLNSKACLHGEVTPADRWVGPIHTNGVWYFDPTIPNIDPTIDSGDPAQVFNGRVTSSCPGVTPGSDAYATCRDEHRWISAQVVGSENDAGEDPTTYVQNEIPVDAYENMLWNPEYDSAVEMPSDQLIGILRQYAVSKGCVFSGPTRIRMTTVSGAGKLVITSPDTLDGSTNSFCFNGGSYKASDAAHGSQPTLTLDYATMVAQGFNGVIYVQDSSLLSAAPSCQRKKKADGTLLDVSSQSYPWVMPTTASETIVITNSNPQGFPSWGTKSLEYPATGAGKEYDEWTHDPDDQCWKGHLYLQANSAGGGYTGQYTIGASADIVLTDDVYESSVVQQGRTNPGPASATNPLWGVPSATSTNQLGLVPSRWLYAYHLESKKGGLSAVDAQLSELLLNFSILAPNKCLTVQDYASQPNMERLKVVGSIGQDYRCRITGGDTGAGYKELIVEYDERLALLGPPPFMAELSQEPWKVKSWSETDVRRDAEARVDVAAVVANQSKNTTRSFDVLAGAPQGSELLYSRVVSGVGTSGASNGQVTYTAPNGITQTIVEFVVRKPSGMRVGQYLTINVS